MTAKHVPPTLNSILHRGCCGLLARPRSFGPPPVTDCASGTDHVGRLSTSACCCPCCCDLRVAIGHGEHDEPWATWLNTSDLAAGKYPSATMTLQASKAGIFMAQQSVGGSARFPVTAALVECYTLCRVCTVAERRLLRSSSLLNSCMKPQAMSRH